MQQQYMQQQYFPSMLTLMLMSHRSSHRCVTQLSVVCDTRQYINGRVHCIKQVTLLYRLGQVSGEAVQIQCRRRRWGVSGPPIRGVASHHHMLPVHSRTHPVTMLHVPLAPILLKCTSRTHPVTVLHVPLAPILLKCTSRTHPVTVLHVPLAPILSPVTCTSGTHPATCTSGTHPVTMLHVPQCSGASLYTRCTSCTLPVHLYQPFTLPVHWLLLQATGCLPHCQPLSQRINCLKETNV